MTPHCDEQVCYTFQFHKITQKIKTNGKFKIKNIQKKKKLKTLNRNEEPFA